MTRFNSIQAIKQFFFKIEFPYIFFVSTEQNKNNGVFSFLERILNINFKWESLQQKKSFFSKAWNIAKFFTKKESLEDIKNELEANPKLMIKFLNKTKTMEESMYNDVQRARQADVAIRSLNKGENRQSVMLTIFIFLLLIFCIVVMVFFKPEEQYVNQNLGLVIVFATSIIKDIFSFHFGSRESWNSRDFAKKN